MRRFLSDQFIALLNVVCLGIFLASSVGVVSVVGLGLTTCSSLCCSKSLSVLWFLIPQSLIFLLIRRKSKRLAVLCYIVPVLLILTVLIVLSYNAEDCLVKSEHFYHGDAYGTSIATDNDRKIYTTLIDRQKSFLLSCQMVSAEACGSALLLAMLLLIVSVKRKWRAGSLILVVVIFLWLIGPYLPFPIVGSWSQIGGCMTTTYNYAVFCNSNVEAYNICAGIGNSGNFGHFAQYKRIAYGSYELKLDGLKDSDKFIVKSSLLQIRMLSNDQWIVAGYRSLDYFTQYRFRKYCDQFLKMRAERNAAIRQMLNSKKS